MRINLIKMSRNYDNWERLVAATLRREQLRELCHSDSMESSLSSQSSEYSSSFRSNNSLSFDFENLKDDEHGFSKYYSGSLPFKTLAGIEKQDASLVFFKGSPFAFDLQELLMASSDVLGGEDGTSRRTFLVRLTEDVEIVVKRLKLDNINSPTSNALEKRIEAIRSIENKNVVKLRGYYLSNSEILEFYDYFSQGSLHQILHGKGWEDRVRLDWETRVKIAISAAKGLAHIHQQSGGKFVHGNIKASNIFLGSNEYACLGDLISADFQISRYHPPEILITKRVSQASDVYNFGVVLIQLLSGRSPVDSTIRHKTFADWARYEALHEWTALVSDTYFWENKGILDSFRINKEILDMLKIALSCVRPKPEERPSMTQVVEMLGILRCEAPVDFFSSYARWTRIEYIY